MGTPDEESQQAGGKAVGRTGARYPSARYLRDSDDAEQAEPATESEPEAREPKPGDPDYVPDVSDLVGGLPGFHQPKPRKKKKKKKADPEPEAVAETKDEPEEAPSPAPEPLPEVFAPPMHQPQFPARRTERVFAAPEQDFDDMVEDGLRVRPYVITRGRTKARSDLNIETLISANPRANWNDDTLSSEYLSVRSICAQPRSVAEVAALMQVPLGVARVLLSDLADEGLVNVHTSHAPQGGRPTYDLMQRVLEGLHRL